MYVIFVDLAIKWLVLHSCSQEAFSIAFYASVFKVKTKNPQYVLTFSQAVYFHDISKKKELESSFC